MKHTFLACFAVSLLLVSADRARAQESDFKPILVGCISSYDGLIESLQFVGELTLNTRFVDSFSTLFSQVVQAPSFKLQELKGIDAKKPWGFAIITDDLQVINLVFMPTTDMEQLLASLAPLVGDAEAEDDLYKIDLGKALSFLEIVPLDLPLPIPEGGEEVTVYVKEQDGWAFMAQLPQHLDELPDPAELLGDLPEKYDFGIELRVQNIPEVFRSLLVDQLIGVGADPEEAGDAAAAFREQATAWQGQLLRALMSEADKLTVGISMDRDTKRVVVDAFIEPLADSDLARHVAGLGEVKTRFGGLRKADGAVITFGVTEALHPALASELSASFDGYRAAVTETIENSEEIKSDEERRIFQEMFSELGDALKPAFDSGHVDMAVRVTGARVPWTLVGAVAVPDTGGLQSVIERAAELAQDDTYFTHMQLDAAKVGETRIHAFTLRGGTEDTRLLETFFGELNFHVAIAPDSLWVAVGPEALAELEKALHGSEASVSPIEISLRGDPLAKGLQALLIQSNRQMATLMGLMGLQWRGDDVLEISVQPSDDKLHVRAELEAGYVRIGAMALPFLSQQVINARSRAAAANSEQ